MVTVTASIQRTIRLLTALMLSAALCLSGCSSARKAFSKGEQLEQEGNYEAAMYRYAEAFNKDATESSYRLSFFRAREAAAKQRAKEGSEQLSKELYADAEVSFETAASLDPTQERFKQQAERATRFKLARQSYLDGLDFEKANKPQHARSAFQRALELHPDHKQYQEALSRVPGSLTTQLGGIDLRLKSTKPLSLKANGTRLKELFSTITRLSGVNFIFDPDFKDQSVTVSLVNSSLRQALDQLASLHKIDYVVINDTAVLIYPQSTEKTRQYQKMQLRTFQLNYLDAKKAANLIKTMLQVRRLYINEDANALVVRDTRDINDVIEKILETHDQPEAEVVLDIEVIEISDKNAKNVGLLLSNYDVQLGAFKGSKLLASTLKDTTSTTSTTVTTDATIDNLVKAFSMGGYGGFVTVPNAQYNFGKTLANGEVLSNPKLRVKNKEKAKFNVGTRVPITTTTMATTGTTSQVNVQYVDVGVKVNAEPTIQLNNEISIKLGLEVSSIISRETVGGKDSATTVVTIGTRNLDTVLSLKDGETSVIGGLIANSKSDSKQKIFILGDIPLIGPLLSNTKTDNDKTELILAITPRLVRGVTVPKGSLRSFTSGNEDRPSLPTAVAQQSSGPAVPAAVKPAAPAVSPPVNVPVSTAPVVPAVIQNTLTINAPSSVGLGQPFKVLVSAEGVSDLKGGSFTLIYTPGLLELLSTTQGTLLGQGNGKETFSTANDPAKGSVTIRLQQADTATGATGSGTLAGFIFKSKGKGNANLTIGQTGFLSATGQLLPLKVTSKSITIQ